MTCLYCSKILKDPVDLPCGDSICSEHLSEKDVKENKLKCTKCNLEFQLKDIQIKSNKVLKNLIEDQHYLSKEEIILKHELEQSIRKLFQFYDEINQNKTKPQLLVSDHFDQIRSQIDQHRDKLKHRIECIALKIKDETKYYEQIYFKGLKESLRSTKVKGHLKTN
jgi:DNA-directed RNA polymerase subunit M/transcription elongation factor TFIIS